MTSTLLIGLAGILAIALLIGLYVRTFGLSVAKPTGTTVAGNTDAQGRTLRQRLDQSNASSRAYNYKE